MKVERGLTARKQQEIEIYRGNPEPGGLIDTMEIALLTPSS